MSLASRRNRRPKICACPPVPPLVVEPLEIVSFFADALGPRVVVGFGRALVIDAAQIAGIVVSDAAGDHSVTDLVDFGGNLVAFSVEPDTLAEDGPAVLIIPVGWRGVVAVDGAEVFPANYEFSYQVASLIPLVAQVFSAGIGSNEILLVFNQDVSVDFGGVDPVFFNGTSGSGFPESLTQGDPSEALFTLGVLDLVLAGTVSVFIPDSWIAVFGAQGQTLVAGTYAFGSI
jgi:hypothetical protein